MAEPATAEPVAAGGLRHRLGEVVRFLLVGGSNTLATLVLFILLQRWLTPTIAYTLVYALGLAYTTAMTARVVFGARLTWRTGAAFIGWYLLVYGVGVLVVHGVHTMWHPRAAVLAVLTLTVTAPLNFLGGRYLFAGRRPSAAVSEAPEPTRGRREPGPDQAVEANGSRGNQEAPGRVGAAC